MSPTVLPTAHRQKGLQGRHVLIMFLAFFAAVFIANGAMIYSALSTYTGLVANEPYRKGLHYNDRIAADARQTRLGWTNTLDVRSDGHVVLALADSGGRPVLGLRVEGVLGRPSTNRYDAKLTFGELAPGHYEARSAALAEGSWLIEVAASAAGGEDPVYRTRRRLWIKP